MSLLSAAASDEDGDTIRALREENEQLRQSLLAMHNTLEMTARAGAHHAMAAECLRETVIRWAARAEQAEEMLEAIGAGGVGSLVIRTDHVEQHLNMAPPAMTTIAQRKLDDLLLRGYTISGYSVYNNTKHQHGFVTAAGLVGWWRPDGNEYQQPKVEQK